jgi:hypothetical protein
MMIAGAAGATAADEAPDPSATAALVATATPASNPRNLNMMPPRSYFVHNAAPLLTNASDKQPPY